MNLINKKYNKLAVIGELKEKDKFGNKLWICQCDCGNNAIVSTHNLVSGHKKSCGCLHKEVLSDKNTKHGLWGTAIYQKWLDIKKRCYNPNSKDYKNYGGRNITICDNWLNDFSAFYEWAINNGYKEGLTIDRINNNGNYEPNNCRWVTRAEQNRNKRYNKRKKQ